MSSVSRGGTTGGTVNQGASGGTGGASAGVPAVDDGFSTLHIVREQVIAAPAAIVWEAMLEQIGPGGDMPGGVAFPMVIEPWPGGRWFRDLGQNAGHLWAHVQVIKPPRLLELAGPLFMSYPAISHVAYRLTEESGRTRLTLTHRAMGLMPAEHKEGVVMGWEHELRRIGERAESKR